MEECAQIALSSCLNLMRHESLLVLCDEPCLEIGQAFFSVGSLRAKEAVMVQITPRQLSGNEPPEQVAELISRFDVTVMPTSKSLTHTRARRNASQHGCRIATLPGITAETFSRTMKTDWERLGVRTRKVASQLSHAQKIEIKTELGTDLVFNTGGRHAKADDGRLNFKGAFGNIPAGEAFLAPQEGSAEGVLVIDGSFPLAGLLSEPLICRVKKGRAAEVVGHPCHKELLKLFIKYYDLARTIAEFGVGTLDTAVVCGHVLEDEKARGTIHIAFGDNASMGGTVKAPVHLDGVVRQPSVWLDGKLWMERGEMVEG